MLNRQEAEQAIQEMVRQGRWTHLNAEDIEQMVVKSMRPIINDPARPYWNASSPRVLELLGIEGKIPVEGLPPRKIQGIMVYVNPLAGEKPKHGKRHTHRVMAICPVCDKHLSAGRLHQHVCKEPHA